jgi:Uma2 family endonuclease
MVTLPKPAPSRMTIGEFLDWPGDGSGQKFELVDGELRAMTPRGVRTGSPRPTWPASFEAT